MEMRGKRAGHLLAGLVLAAEAAAVLTGSITAQAKAAYPTKYSQEISMKELLAPAFYKETDPVGLALQIQTAMRYGSLTRMDLWSLYQSGAKIPAETLHLLSGCGLIPGFWYKMAAGLPFEDSDFAGVYDAEYYAEQNPAVKKALDDGTLRKEDLLLNFIVVGMPAGLAGSAEFDPSAFQRENPKLAESLGSPANWYYYHMFS